MVFWFGSAYFIFKYNLVLFYPSSFLPQLVNQLLRDRYDIFCKAAYAKLKESTQSGITARQCEMVFCYLHINIFTFFFCIIRLTFLGSGSDAFEASIAAVSKYGGAVAGYRTLLDALIPASTVLREV